MSVFRMGAYGTAAVMKLLNNTLGTYNLLSTAHVLTLASRHGIPAGDFLDVIRASSGASWMGEHFADVQVDLLLKDVGLLRGEIGALPSTDLGTHAEEEISRARAILAGDLG